MSDVGSDFGSLSNFLDSSADADFGLGPGPSAACGPGPALSGVAYGLGSAFPAVSSHQVPHAAPHQHHSQYGLGDANNLWQRCPRSLMDSTPNELILPSSGPAAANTFSGRGVTPDQLPIASAPLTVGTLAGSWQLPGFGSGFAPAPVSSLPLCAAVGLGGSGMEGDGMGAGRMGGRGLGAGGAAHGLHASYGIDAGSLCALARGAPPLSLANAVAQVRAAYR